MPMTGKPPTQVVLQLPGGNDALNRVIPYGDPRYYEQRPSVRLPEDQALPIDDRYGFHPSLAALKPVWDQGKTAIINGIGYPQRTIRISARWISGTPPSPRVLRPTAGSANWCATWIPRLTTS